MKKELFLLLSLLFFYSSIVDAKTEIIDVQPNDIGRKNNLYEAIHRAHQLKADSVIINLQLGTYYFSRDESVKEIYYVSNTTSEKENPDPTKHIGLLLKDLKNIIVEGNGSKLVMTGKMTSFVIDDCENITFRNMSFDYLHPTQTEMKILEKGDNYLVARVHPTSQYRINNGKLEWYGDGWSFSGGIAQAYDYERDITWRTESPMSGLIKTTELDKNKLLLEYAVKPDAEEGLVYQMRDGIRDEVCGFIHKSKNVRFENCNFYYLGNFGIVGQYSENITFDGANFEPEPGSGRTNAGFADFIQISGCKGLIDIRNSRFTGAHDDPINIHGTHLHVVEFIGKDKIRVRFMHHQSYGFDAFFKDDEIEFIDSQSLLSIGNAKIIQTQRINEREILLTVSKSLPETILLNKDLVVENTTWTPDVKIINNYFSRIPTRGILVSTRGKILVERNTFYRMQMSGILIADDALSWYESGMVKDVAIRNNYFIECGTPVIFIEPENKVHKGAVHKNIKIENNKFKLKNVDDVAVQAKSVDGLTIKNNLFILNDDLENEMEYLIKTKDCIHINTENNKSEKP